MSQLPFHLSSRNGLPHQRVWARVGGVGMTYHYTAAGELERLVPSPGGTPEVVLRYDRAGRLREREDAAGRAVHFYEGPGGRLSRVEHLPVSAALQMPRPMPPAPPGLTAGPGTPPPLPDRTSLLAGAVIRYEYEPGGGGRKSGFISQWGDRELSRVGYTHEPGTGRLAGVSLGGK